MFKLDPHHPSFRDLLTRATRLRSALLLALSVLVPFAAAEAYAQTTTISGSVYAPNGADTLPNVLVYVTTGAVAPFVSGAQCPGADCQTASNAVPVNALATTYTLPDGSFTLAGVAQNTAYTLVIQAGKWRRQFPQTVSTSPIAGLHLDFPSTHAQGDIPLMALATGSADALECALRDVGVADSEFTDDNSSNGGRIHLYLGAHSPGAQISGSTPSENTLMSTPATLNRYDLVLFPCQGTSAAESTANIDNLLSYTSAGGRVFATHLSKNWIDTNESIESGTYAGATYSGVADWSTQSSPPDGVATINTSFTDGARLAHWMQSMGESYMGTLGQVAISTLRHDTTGINAPTQSWLTLNSDSAIMQFSFNTPVGAAAADQYGRVFFNEYHVENTGSSSGQNFPNECGAPPHTPLSPASMSAQEKMLEYTLFDLTNFVTPIVLPTVSVAITTTPTNSVFNEGDTADTITVDVSNTSSTNPLDASTILGVTLPSGVTATSMTDTAGGWNCTVGTLSCTRSTPLAPNASDSVLLTVTVAGDATGSSQSTSVSVGATVSNPTFSSNVTAPLTITMQRHAAVTWATPSAIAAGTPLSSTQLNAAGNTAGTYVYSPPSGTVLTAGTHTLSVTFTPTDQVSYPGTATTSVTLVVNSPSSANVTAPALVSFGPTPVATTSSTQNVTFTVTNPGTVGSVAVTAVGAAGSDFTDAGTGTCSTNGASYVYSPGASCTVDVLFTPTHPGQRYGAVLLKDASGHVLGTGYLTGVGTGPQVNFLPTTELTPVTSASGIALPLSLALDGNGNLYTADASNHAIFRTTLQGVTTRVVDLSSTGGAPQSLAVDGAGNLYIVDTVNSQVLEATLSGGNLVLASTPLFSEISNLSALAVNLGGNVYLSQGNNLLLESLQPNGTYVQSTLISASDLISGLSLSSVSGVAIDSGNNVYLSDTGNNRVIKETHAADSYVPSLVASGLDAPSQIAVDGMGNLYVANFGLSNPANGHLYKETPSGSSFVQTIVPSSIAAAHISGVAVDGGGNVYLSDATDVKVVEENSVSAPSLTFASTHVGSVSGDSPQPVMVENVGNAPLIFTPTGLVAPPDFSQVAESGSVADCADSASVAAGSACNLSIQFAPTITGSPLSESFLLSDNALNAAPATQSIALSGPATAAILALLPAGSTLANGVAGSPYTPVSFFASGGTAPYTYSVTGTLPAGLALSGSGVLSGTPTTAGGPYSFTITATDASSSTTARTYTITVNPAASSYLSLGSLPESIISGNNLGTLTVAVKDADGVTVANSSALVSLSINGPGGYSQSANATAANGLATFNLSSLPLTVAGLYTVSATSPGLTAASGTVSVTAGPAVQMPVSGIPSTIVAGANLGTAVARIEDANGNTVTTSAAPVTTTIIGPNHYLQAVTVTAVHGIATLDLTSLPLTVTGAYTATTTSPALPTSVTSVVVTAGAPAQIAPSSIPSTLPAGGNLGSISVSIEDRAGNVVTSSSALVSILITGPGGYSQTASGVCVNGVATIDLSSLILTTTGTYTLSISSSGLPSVNVTVVVAQAFTLAFAPGSGMAPTQTVTPGAPAVFPFTLAPNNIEFNAPITLSATGLPPGATYSFSPPVVTPGAAPVNSTLTVQTAKATAALQDNRPSSGLGTAALALLLLPLAASRRLRKAARQIPMAALALAVLSLGAVCGLTGCGAGGLFGKAPQTYTITVTGTSGSLSQSTTVTLIVQ